MVFAFSFNYTSSGKHICGPDVAPGQQVCAPELGVSPRGGHLATETTQAPGFGTHVGKDWAWLEQKLKGSSGPAPFLLDINIIIPISQMRPLRPGNLHQGAHLLKARASLCLEGGAFHQAFTSLTPPCCNFSDSFQ